MTSFTVFPAIDLRKGQVVRLQEGDPQRQTHYSSDPAQIAEKWLQAGAKWLHVVNLDGAFGESSPENHLALQAILEVADRFHAYVQFGGGIRSQEAIDQILAEGVTRAVLGTLAIEQPAVLSTALAKWGVERLAVSLDSRDGIVQVRGWQKATEYHAVDLARDLYQQGLRWLVYTDIARDGLQTGLNLPATLELAKVSHLNVIASGGVRSWEDINSTRQGGLVGVIVGRALYEGFFDAVKLFSS